MIKLFSGKYQRHVAWLLLFVFYGELAVNLYATRGMVPYINYERPVRQAGPLYLPMPATSIPAGSKQDIAAVEKSTIEIADKVEAIPVAAEAIPVEKDEIDKVDIGGPGQPEMSTFKSVSSSDMVNLFTGDFSYNIPLGDVGGFPLNIFYNAGIGMDQEASWVGLGWNLNPGTISRNMRGLPDDYNGAVDMITKEQSMKSDLTIGAAADQTPEFLGTPLGKLSFNYGFGIFYNNRRGLGLSAGVTLDYDILKDIKKKAEPEKGQDSVKIATGLSANLDLNSQNGMSFGANFDVMRDNIDKANKWSLSTGIDVSSRTGLSNLHIEGEYSNYKNARSTFLSGFARVNSNISFARTSFVPSIRMPVTRSNYTFTLKLGKAKTGFFKNHSIRGYVQDARIKESDQVQKKPAYGYMYYEKANKNADALLDFNRLNDGVFTKKTPLLSVPVYTYDVFTINGEGTGGSFRGYRGNMGYMRDNATHNKTGSVSVFLELGKGGIFHGGTNLGGVYSPSFVREWKTANTLGYSSAFNKTDSIYETFYFKNPGEKAIIDQDYYEAMGGDQLVRPHLGDRNSPTPFLRSSFQVFDHNRELQKTLAINANNSYRATRDKRTQVITFLTAGDASEVALDKYIYSYTENQFKPGNCSDDSIKTAIPRFDEKNHPLAYRKKNHISKMEILEASGQRYIYGIPAYQVKQQEVSFSITGSPSGQRLIPYAPGVDNSTKNSKGRDGYFQRETMNGYAHSFLLTGILSPDYVDVTGDGITDDDHGTAIKFKYSRINKKTVQGQNSWETFKWRMPMDSAKANHNEGLRADPLDDKALYTYGEKELWYTHSIESKNMVATFHISDRNDGYPVVDDNGGLNENGVRLQKLDSISFYTKAEFARTENPRPIKRVRLWYSYKLCKKFPGNKDVRPSGNYNASGKLTLDSITFAYNGNTRQRKNKYVFKYSDNNPDYNLAHNDRWGNYKPEDENEGDLTNNDYPYTIQNSSVSNTYAAAWNLEKILLPGGGLMSIEYEADDYGYVQDKRASQMTKLVGFAKEGNGIGVSNKLYTGMDDNMCVYFDAGQPITLPQVKERYFQNMTQLLMKLWVKMPKGNVGNPEAYQPVIIYGAIEQIGVDPLNSSHFFVKLKHGRKGNSPIMETVMDFLKEQLPGRAYPGYEVTGNGAVVQVVRAVFGMISGFVQGVLGFERELKMAGKCKVADLEKSFARLNNPGRKKIGGGYRVKKIVVMDNWKKMVDPTLSATYVHNSEYGQTYDYTTTEEINGVQTTISSGVASYEPGIGNEENPFREVLKYEERQFLGPIDPNNVELPVAETFFPSPMVGYSKVKVRSIHTKETRGKDLKSGIGMQQTEFYTTRDFPVIAEYTSFDHDSRKNHRPSAIAKIFEFDRRDYLTLTQGFRIVLNDMNGKIKSQTSYAENDLLNPVNYTENFYRMKPVGSNRYRLDNTIPVVSGPDGKITDKLIGKDIEVMNDFREYFSYTMAANIPLNLDFFKVGNIPVLIPRILKLIFRDESMFRSATTLKVVNEYGILDSVVNVDKGSVVGTKNMVYDAETGNPVITRTNNEFRKPVYSFSYPAWWTNTVLEPAYRNIDLTYTNVLFRNGRIEESPHVNMDRFESGDEIYVSFKDAEGPMNSVACALPGCQTRLSVNPANLVWAVDIRKDVRNSDKQFLFLDRDGNPYNAANATIRVIRSGKRNLVDASVGSIVSLENPVVNDDGRKILINNDTKVINAAAAEFKEKWRVNDMFYAKDSLVHTIRLAPVTPVYLSPINKHAFGAYKPKSGERYFDNIPDPDNFSAMHYNNGGNGRDFKINSWMEFSFVGIPAGSTIQSATLNLSAHTHLLPNFNHTYQIHKNPHHAICPDNIPVYDVEPSHGNSNPHISTPSRRNDFIISRMMSAWPSDVDCQLWENIYNSSVPDNASNRTLVTGTSPWSSQMRYNIPLTRVVQSMVEDYHNPSKNYAAGLRIDLAAKNNVSDKIRMCFWAEQGGKHGPPVLEVHYYSCSPDDDVYYEGGIDSVPPGPPPAGYAFCPSDRIITYCLSHFDKKKMNPYIQHAIGNPRPYRSYVYYGERRESDPTVATDIRKDGVIKDFVPYWTLAANNKEKLGKSGSDKWVWNSEITQYNRKGAELENHDPLNRYNSGIYGYQETLPVAVTNNSRLRLSAYDGFEDYFYKDEHCDPLCKPYIRHFKTNPSLTDSQAHTGKYSARILPNGQYYIDVPVTENDSIDVPDVLIQLDSIEKQMISVTPKGIGLKATYYNRTDFNASNGSEVRSPEYVNLSFKADGNGCKDRDEHPENKPPDPNINCKNISVKWEGRIQAIKCGKYKFDLGPTDDAGSVFIDDVEVTRTTFGGGVIIQNEVDLMPGTLHKIEIRFVQEGGYGLIYLRWKEPGNTSFTTIPMKHLYPLGQEGLATGSTDTLTVYCVKPDTIQVVKHQFIDTLNLIAGKKMVASVWMKKGGQDCKCKNYTNNYKVKNGETTLATFVARERIIEGWQQFEAVFEVPLGASSIRFDFPGVDSVSYIDDLRIHPFNANMKSFVYDPVTLRLSAELDENNFAAFYEYDDDGGLIRVKKETREGIKTINETRSATQKNITNIQ